MTIPADLSEAIRAEMCKKIYTHYFSVQREIWHCGSEL
jgi:hypothetical protein